MYGQPSPSSYASSYPSSSPQSSSYITYNDYPVPDTGRRMMQDPAYKIPTYTKPQALPQQPRLREDFFTTNELRQLRDMNLQFAEESKNGGGSYPPQAQQQSASLVVQPTETSTSSPRASPPPAAPISPISRSSQSETMTPQGTDSPTPDHPMSIPCLQVFSHLKTCPLCRQAIQASILGKEQNRLELLSKIQLGVLGLALLMLSVGIYYGRHYLKTIIGDVTGTSLSSKTPPTAGGGGSGMMPPQRRVSSMATHPPRFARMGSFPPPQPMT